MYIEGACVCVVAEACLPKGSRDKERGASFTSLKQGLTRYFIT